MYAFSQVSNERIATVHPDLQKVVRLALRISSRRKDGGVDFSIPIYGGKRTREEQQELFKKGVSKADGYDKPSFHQTGLALDVIPYLTADGIKGNAIYTKKISKQKRELAFHMIASCMLEAAHRLNVKLTAGINWQTFTDAPHYELKQK
jgi:hypothetical protein